MRRSRSCTQFSLSSTPCELATNTWNYKKKLWFFLTYPLRCLIIPEKLSFSHICFNIIAHLSLILHLRGLSLSIGRMGGKSGPSTFSGLSCFIFGGIKYLFTTLSHFFYFLHNPKEKKRANGRSV